MPTSPEFARTVLRNPVHLLAFGFGSGLAPKAPGTFGTLAAVPFYLLLAQLPLQGGWWANKAVLECRICSAFRMLEVFFMVKN